MFARRVLDSALGTIKNLEALRVYKLLSIKVSALACFIASLIAMCAVSNADAQQVITRCGASQGKTFQLEPDKPGWHDDGISGGTITFLRLPSGDYDVVFPSFTARGDGAQVFKVHGTDDRLLTLVAIYPLHVTEVYQLTLDGSGRGTLIWANTKNRAGFRNQVRGFLFVAECSR